MRIEHVMGDVETGSGSLDLSRAIMLYDRGSLALATIHDVAKFDDGQPPTILPGRCLTRESLVAILGGLSGGPQAHEILPASVISSDALRLAWWVPSARRPIFFNTGDKEFNRDVDGKNVRYPALLFVAKPGVLSVFALAKDERPGEKTKLFRAPFLNLYEAGNMCSGDTRLPGVVQSCDIPAWERSFFETRFTHSNLHGRELTKFKGGHNALWRAMVEAESFPGKALLPIETTLQEAIDQ
jgi:PRTRC genetic system protein B